MINATSAIPSTDEVTVERVATLDDVRDDWERISAGSCNIFTSWDWTALWWHHFSTGQMVLYRAVAGSRTVAILPLQRSVRFGVRVIRFMGHGPGDQLGPVHRPGDEDLAAAAIRAVLADIDGTWDVFLAERMPRSLDWAARLGAERLRTEANPILELDGRSWEELLAARSANFREQVRRRERGLVRKHSATYRLADDPSGLRSDMETLFHLHELRWGQTSRALTERRKRFHQDFAERALRRGWLRLWFLEVGGQAVGVWYGFSYGDAVSYYQAGRNPAWDRYSPGFVLLAHTIRAAIDEGAAEYRLLRGDEPYKSRFASSDEGLETLVVPHGTRGRAVVDVGHRALGRAPRARSALRRIIG